MKRILLLLWNNKQAITGTVTAAVSLAAGAGMMTAELAVKITAATGIVTLVLGLGYTLFTASKEPPIPPPAPETLR